MRVRKRFDAEKIRKIEWISGIVAIFFRSPGVAFFIVKKTMALDRWMVDEWLKGV